MTIAWTMFASGRSEEALDLIRQAMRLNPIYPDWWLMVLEEAHTLIPEWNFNPERGLQDEVSKAPRFSGKDISCNRLANMSWVMRKS